MLGYKVLDFGIDSVVCEYNDNKVLIFTIDSVKKEFLEYFNKKFVYENSITKFLTKTLSKNIKEPFVSKVDVFLMRRGSRVVRGTFSYNTIYDYGKNLNNALKKKGYSFDTSFQKRNVKELISIVKSIKNKNSIEKRIKKNLIKSLKFYEKKNFEFEFDISIEQFMFIDGKLYGTDLIYITGVYQKR